MKKQSKNESSIGNAFKRKGRPDNPNFNEKMDELMKALKAVKKEPSGEVRVILPGEVIDPYEKK